VIVYPAQPSSELPQPICVGARVASQLLGVSPRTLGTWRKAGLIPSIEIGGRVLFCVEELKLWAIERSRTAIANTPENHHEETN
jgi:hypothetical protein